MAEFSTQILVQKQLWLAAAPPAPAVLLWKAKGLDSDPHLEPKTTTTILLRLLHQPLLPNQTTTMILHLHHHQQRPNGPQVPVPAPAAVEVLLLVLVVEVEVTCYCSGGREREQGCQGLRSELSLMTHHLHPQLLSRLRGNHPPQLCHLHPHLPFLPLLLLLMSQDPEGKLLPFFPTGIKCIFIC